MSMPHNAMKHTPPYSCLQVPAEKGQPHSASRLIPELEAMCYPSMCFNVFIQIRSTQLAYPLALILSVPDSLPTMDPIYPYMVHSHGPITWQPDHTCSQPHRVKSYWYVADTPGPATLGLPSSEKLAVMKMNCAITVRWPSTHPAPVSTTVATTKPAIAPEAAKSIRSTDDLINKFPDQFKGIGQFPGKYQIWLCHDAHPHDTCPQEMPHCLMSEGQGAPWQDGMSRCDHPHRWTNGLCILHYLHPEGKWQAMSVLGSLWPQWGHPTWPSQDTHCGGSCLWVCTLSLLH